MPKRVANGVELYYEERGTGEPLVLLHGLGSSSEDWVLQFPAFAERYRVIAVDLRGHGRSEAPDGTYSIRLFAEDVAALMDRLDVDAAHLLGLSLGGLVAQQLALDWPERMRSLVLVNTYAELNLGGVKESARLFLRAFLLRVVPLRFYARLLARRMFPKPEHDELREMAVGRIERNDRDAYRRSFKAAIRFDVSDRLGNVRCPTLVVAGDRDGTVSFRHKERLYQLIPKAELKVIEDSGHATPIDQPQAFNRAVLDFLRRVGRPQVRMRPIGQVHNEALEKPPSWEDRVSELIIDEEWAAGLEGIEGFSHLIVVFSLHRIAETELRVHPEGREYLPKVGVFATRAPVRPNHIGVTVVELLDREENVLRVKGLDALDGSPILDVKPYLARGDRIEAPQHPDWIRRLWAAQKEL